MSSRRRLRSSQLSIILSLALIAVSCTGGATGDETEAASVAASPTTATDQTSGPAPASTSAPSTTTSTTTTSTSAPEGASTSVSQPATSTTADGGPDDAEVAPVGTGDFTAVTEAVEEIVGSRGLGGAGLIVVHENAGVIYEEYFGAFSAERISLIASSSKMISAGVLLRLQDDGLLDLNAPIEDIVDWASGNPDMTAAQLISSSSGLVGLWPDLAYAPYRCQWVPTGTLQACGATIFNSTADDADQAPPDTEFRYGGAQWQLAGAVAEAVSGKSWDQLIEEIYVEPCGLDSLGYVSLGAVSTGPKAYPVAFGGDPDSVTSSANPSIGGGAHITASDYGKLLLMQLRGGWCGSNQVLSPAALDTMHTDRIAEVYDGNAEARDTGYGMGWWIDRGTGRLRDPGLWGAVSWLDLEGRYGVYLVIEDRMSAGTVIKRRIERLIDEAVTGG